VPAAQGIAQKDIAGMIIEYIEKNVNQPNRTRTKGKG